MPSGPNAATAIGKQTLDFSDNGHIRLSRDRIAACGLDISYDTFRRVDPASETKQ
jgi:hypothetical protein